MSGRIAFAGAGPANAGDKGTLGINRTDGAPPREKTADVPTVHGGRSPIQAVPGPVG